jgi:hypothetical protein
VTHTAAYERFIASMKIGYTEWHDGVPYDLDALSSVSSEELGELEALLIQRMNEDWRDSEALAKVHTGRTIHALKESMKGPNREVRLRAAELLHGMGQLDKLDDVIIEGLRFGELGKGLAQAERLAAAHPSEAVKGALIRGALCSDDGRAVRFVGILFYLHGKAREPFDWKQRPFFLRFNTKDRHERQKAFDEMCRLIGIDGSNVSCSSDNIQASVQLQPG